MTSHSVYRHFTIREIYTLYYGEEVRCALLTFEETQWKRWVFFFFYILSGMRKENYMNNDLNITTTPPTMTPEEFKQAMADARHKFDVDKYDEEDVHIKMDDIMCDLLRSLGYGEGIDIFNNTPMWYS